jgi:hypothetical protein
MGDVEPDLTPGVLALLSPVFATDKRKRNGTGECESRKKKHLEK